MAFGSWRKSEVTFKRVIAWKVFVFKDRESKTIFGKNLQEKKSNFFSFSSNFNHTLYDYSLFCISP